ncbi:anaerobic ribonucleoside-triphosphate reductase activating protein [Olsenella massiliensis]|uniref:anaerobic ribonucleoside-triphosphate reductase activating protein n=1 Tax=Olsenella massiliensis TaxID=1622075 RepID=UPI00071CC4E0|nr:anaerobic ribonucleoside-triphosphate reductase activating protein [Olsenella massiliensis]
MNVSAIKTCDIANGPGVRSSLFVSGCRRHCPFCFNQQAADFGAGRPFDAAAQEELMESLSPAYVDGITILGGEPMEVENQGPLADFLELVRRRQPDKGVWLYSGFTWEELTGAAPVAAPYAASPRTENTDRLLELVDVLVDGPFVQALHDISLRFRGSSNQRLIDVRKSRAAGEVILWRDDPLFETHAL